jgi:hypothetical protein
MAATQTLPQAPQPSNSSKPTAFPDSPKSTQTVEALVLRRGVVTLFGYGIKVSGNRSHVIFEDGIGTARRRPLVLPHGAGAAHLHNPERRPGLPVVIGNSQVPVDGILGDV